MKPAVVLQFALLLLCALGCTRLHAQDAGQLLQQLTSLQQEMQGASDPCPFMPRFRQIMGQFASQSPEMYQAMKPTLDLLNSQGDGCPSGSNATAASPRDASGAAVAPMAATAPQSTHGAPTSAVCPASGFSGMRQNGDTAVGIPCTPGQPIANTGTSISGPGGTTPPAQSTDPGPCVAEGSSIAPGTTARCPPAACREMTLVVRNTTKMIPDGPFSCPSHMSNTLTNATVGTVTCVWAYLVGNQYGPPSMSSIAPGQTIGGQWGGMDQCNASGMKYYCFDGKNPTDSHGSCFANIRWQ